MKHFFTYYGKPQKKSVRLYKVVPETTALKTVMQYLSIAQLCATKETPLNTLFLDIEKIKEEDRVKKETERKSKSNRKDEPVKMPEKDEDTKTVDKTTRTA